MTDNTPDYEFNRSEFDALCETAKTAYTATVMDTSKPDVIGAICEFVSDNWFAAMNTFHNQLALGWTALPNTSTHQHPKTFGTKVKVYLYKPQCQQDSELATIYQDVGRQYQATLDARFEAEVSRQTKISIAAAEAAKEEALQKERAGIAEQTRAALIASRATTTDAVAA